MSYNLNYTIQVAGAHTYSKCVGDVLLLGIGEKGHFNNAGEAFDEPPTQDTDCASDQNPNRAFGQGRDAMDQWRSLSPRLYEPPG